VAQDVFSHLYLSASRYKPTAKLSTYLYRIGVNLSLNRIRDIKRKRLISLEAFNTGKGRNPISMETERPDTLLEQKEKLKQVWKAIERLPKNQKTAVILKRFEDLSYDEIAKVMECSVSAVESLLHRAKLNLQKNLSESQG
jgi:RNA polymerase sigma-70 factor (ECF subfamily)